MKTRSKGLPDAFFSRGISQENYHRNTKVKVSASTKSSKKERDERNAWRRLLRNALISSLESCIPAQRKSNSPKEVDKKILVCNFRDNDHLNLKKSPGMEASMLPKTGDNGIVETNSQYKLQSGRLTTGGENSTENDFQYILRSGKKVKKRKRGLTKQHKNDEGHLAKCQKNLSGTRDQVDPMGLVEEVKDFSISENQTPSKNLPNQQKSRSDHRSPTFFQDQNLKSIIKLSKDSQPSQDFQKKNLPLMIKEMKFNKNEENQPLNSKQKAGYVSSKTKSPKSSAKSDKPKESFLGKMKTPEDKEELHYLHIKPKNLARIPKTYNGTTLRASFTKINIEKEFEEKDKFSDDLYGLPTSPESAVKEDGKKDDKRKKPAAKTLFANGVNIEGNMQLTPPMLKDLTSRRKGQEKIILQRKEEPPTPIQLAEPKSTFITPEALEYVEFKQSIEPPEKDGSWSANRRYTLRSSKFESIFDLEEHAFAREKQRLDDSLRLHQKHAAKSMLQHTCPPSNDNNGTPITKKAILQKEDATLPSLVAGKESKQHVDVSSEVVVKENGEIPIHITMKVSVPTSSSLELQEGNKKNQSSDTSEQKEMEDHKCLKISDQPLAIKSNKDDQLTASSDIESKECNLKGKDGHFQDMNSMQMSKDDGPHASTNSFASKWEAFELYRTVLLDSWERIEIQRNRKRSRNIWKEIKVSRRHVASNMLKEDFFLSTTTRGVFCTLFVKIMRETHKNRREAEDGADEGGLTNEAFTLFYEQLDSVKVEDPDFRGRDSNNQVQLFERSSDGVIVIPKKYCDIDGKAYRLTQKLQIIYFAIGKILLRSIIHRNIVPSALASSLLLDVCLGYERRLVQKPLEMLKKELIAIDPSYKWVLRMLEKGSSTTFGDILLSESTQTINSNADRKECLQAFIKQQVLDPRAEQFQSIAKGFTVKDQVNVSPFLELCSYPEMKLLISGDEELTAPKIWNVLTFTHEFDSQHTTIGYLRQALNEMNPSQLRLFLKFATGLTAIPHTLGPCAGFKITIQSFEDGRTSGYPLAHTCAKQIDMPAYSTLEDLKNKLIVAIQPENAAFTLI